MSTPTSRDQDRLKAENGSDFRLTSGTSTA